MTYREFCKTQEFNYSKLLGKAAEICGIKEVIRRKIEKGFTLWTFEKEWLLKKIF